MDINTKLTNLQEIIGNPDTITAMIEDLHSKLHIIKAYSVICNLTNALKEVENDEYFPVLEINTLTDENNDINGFNLLILYRSKDNEIPSLEFQKSLRQEKEKVQNTVKYTNTSEILHSYMPVMIDNLHGHIVKIKLTYDIEENSNTLLKAFLTEKQLKEVEIMLLNKELAINEEPKRKIKL